MRVKHILRKVASGELTPEVGRRLIAERLFRARIVFGIVALVGAFAMGSAAVILTCKTYEFKENAVQAEGVVAKEAVERGHGAGAGRRRGGRGGRIWRSVAFVEFEVDQKVRWHKTRNLPFSYEVGEDVTVLYPAGNLAAARIDSFTDLWLTPTCLFCGTGMFLLVSLGAFASAARIRARDLRAGGQTMMPAPGQKRGRESI